jgi:hypothetical protein
MCHINVEKLLNLGLLSVRAPSVGCITHAAQSDVSSTEDVLCLFKQNEP